MNKPNLTRILLVDDHPLIREGIARALLQDEGLAVCGEAESVDTALDAIERLRPDFLIADLSLRDSNGLDLLTRLKKQRKAIPVLVVSMHDEPVYIEQAFKAGARGYLLKRESSTLIVTAVRRILSGKTYTSETVSDTLVEGLARRESWDGIDPQAVLSEREWEIFRRLGQGQTRQEIAEQFHVSVRTVDTHLERMKTKLQVPSIYHLLHFAIKHLIKTG